MLAFCVPESPPVPEQGRGTEYVTRAVTLAGQQLFVQMTVMSCLEACAC